MISKKLPLSRQPSAIPDGTSQDHDNLSTKYHIRPSKGSSPASIGEGTNETCQSCDALRGEDAIAQKWSILGTVDGNRQAYWMITRYIAARNDTEYSCRTTERLLITGVEECGVARVKTQGDRPYFKVGRDAASFDREISQLVITIRFQSLWSR
jgi:hypothetical protein